MPLIKHDSDTDIFDRNLFLSRGGGHWCGSRGGAVLVGFEPKDGDPGAGLFDLRGQVVNAVVALFVSCRTAVQFGYHLSLKFSNSGR
jgi:hypothetical protein